ncbi:MAG: sucrase ferredoxin [Cyanobacteria bacterium P01_F01_bin.153]
MLQDCQFCSVVSKNNGEDPIGTAVVCDRWLLIETPFPWSMEKWQSDPSMRPTLELFQHLILDQGMKLRPLAIAPDRVYSQIGYRRVLYYERPAPMFSRYVQQEYLVPTDQVHDLLVALLTQPERLSEFLDYRQPGETRDLMICTHGNIDVACARFGIPIYKQLRNQYASALDDSGDPPVVGPETASGQAAIPLRVWRCSHFGGHRFAPTLIDLPTGQLFGHLEPQHLEPLVRQQGEWSELNRCYRGWAGGDPLVQVVERELWMRFGWDWLAWTRQGVVTSPFEEDSPSNAIVQLEFQQPDGTVKHCEAMVEIIGEVETASGSGVDMALKSVKQYRVSRLVLNED